MQFQWLKSDGTLTKTLALGGCGLSATEVAGITVQQAQTGYEFCYHTGYHGDGANHYVYLRDQGSTQKVGCSRTFINGPKAGQTENTGSLKGKFVTDANNVVSNNQALFLKIAKAQ